MINTQFVMIVYRRNKITNDLNNNGNNSFIELDFLNTFLIISDWRKTFLKKNLKF